MEYVPFPGLQTFEILKSYFLFSSRTFCSFVHFVVGIFEFGLFVDSCFSTSDFPRSYFLRSDFLRSAAQNHLLFISSCANHAIKIFGVLLSE